MVDLLLTPLPGYVYTLIAFLMVVGSAVKGYFRGAAKEYFGIFNLVMCIPLAIPFGWFVGLFGLFGEYPDMLQKPMNEAVGGLIAYILLIIGSSFLYRYCVNRYELPEKWAKWTKIAGAAIGALFAFLLILILSWFMLTVGDLARVAVQQHEATKDAGNASDELILLPTKMIDAHTQGLEDSLVGGIATETSPVPEEVTHGLDVASEILEDQEKMQKIVDSEPMKELMTTDAVEEYMQNEEIRDLAEEGNLLELLKHPATDEMLKDPELQEKMKDVDVQEILQVVEEEPLEEEQMEVILENDAVQRFLENEEIMKLAEEGDLNAIMSHPAMMELMQDPDFNPDDLMEAFGN